MNLTISDWVLSGAALLGPILAVAATRIVDHFRDRSQRRYSIFVALMATRRAQLNWSHIEAINKIEVEFSRDRDIIQSLRKYMELLEERTPENSDDLELHTKRRSRAFADLITSMGRELGISIDKNDFIEGGYYPQGVADYESLQISNMRQLNALLSMKRPLLVVQQPYKVETQEKDARSKYPAPPE